MTTPCALIFQLHIVVPHMHGANIWTPQQQNNDHDDSPRSHKSICHDLSPQEDGKDNFFPPSLRKSGMKWNNLVCECDDTTQSKPRCFLTAMLCFLNGTRKKLMLCTFLNLFSSSNNNNKIHNNDNNFYSYIVSNAFILVSKVRFARGKLQLLSLPVEILWCTLKGFRYLLRNFMFRKYCFARVVTSR